MGISFDYCFMIKLITIVVACNGLVYEVLLKVLIPLKYSLIDYMAMGKAGL